MSDDRRVYSDEEFALILRKAAELASRAEAPGASSGGLTLTDMKAAAAQVGFEPALIERAAQLLAVKTTESPIERLLGGPLRHDQTVHFHIELDETRAARLLSAVRISAGEFGAANGGHSSSMGVTWHDGGEGEALRVTARAEEDGTSVSVVLDRRSTLVNIGVFCVPALILSGIFLVALFREAPVAAVAGSMAGMGSVLAIARGYWASSTKKARERISRVMDAIGQTLTQPEKPSSFSTEDGASVSEAETSAPQRLTR